MFVASWCNTPPLGNGNDAWDRENNLGKKLNTFLVWGVGIHVDKSIGAFDLVAKVQPQAVGSVCHEYS